MKQTIHVAGMSCMHCQKHVQGALLSLKNVRSAEVDFKTGIAVLETVKAVESAEVKRVLDDAGYQLVSVGQPV